MVGYSMAWHYRTKLGYTRMLCLNGWMDGYLLSVYFGQAIAMNEYMNLRDERTVAMAAYHGINVWYTYMKLGLL